MGLATKRDVFAGDCRDAGADRLSRTRVREVPIAGLAWLTTFVVLLPFLVLVGFGLSHWVERERASEVRRVSQYAEALAKAVDRELQGHLETAQVLASSKHFLRGDITAEAEWAGEIASKAGAHVVIVDRSMRQVVNTRVPAGVPLPITGNAEAFRDVFESGKPAIADLEVGTVSGKTLMSIRLPIFVDREVRYVLAYVLPESAIQEVLQQSVRPDGWFASVLDGSGRIVARSDGFAQYFGKPATPEFLALLKSGTGMAESVDLQGRAAVTGYHRTASVNWHAVIWVPKSLLEAPTTAAFRLMLTLAAGTLLVSLVASWLLNLALAAPVHRLAAAANSVGAGVPVSFPPTIIREVNVTGSALEESARSIANRQMELLESEARFRTMADFAPVMIWVSDAEGAVSFLSQSWYEFTGFPSEHGLGQGCFDAVHPDDREQARSAISSAGENYVSLRIEYRLRRADGTYRWMIDAARPRFGPNGVFMGYIGSVLDITDIKNAEQALQASATFTRRVLDNLFTFAGVLETDGTVLQINRAPLDAGGLALSDVQGRKFWDCYWWSHSPQLQDDLRKCCQRAALGETIRYDVEIRMRDDSRMWCDVQIAPLRDESGRITHLIPSGLELTQRKRAEDAMRHSEERMRLALEAGRMGAWTIHFAENRAEADDFMLELFGMTRDVWSGKVSGIMKRIVTDDRLAVRAAVDEALASREPFRVDFRVRLPDGATRWLAGRGRIDYDANGRAVLMRGVNYDITQRKRREEQIGLLMREVNHRSKNMLGLVLAVARQTVSRNPVDFVARFTERVQALAASQDVLVSNDWEGADMRALAHAQLAHFQDLVGDRIVLNGPAIELAPAATQSIGMALHELSTNAGKYGALSNSTGKVDVRWDLSKPPEAKFSLRWVESGGPRVTPPETSGFGSTVIGTMVQFGLGGEVELDYAEAGLRWKLVCPAENALEFSSRPLNPSAR